MIHDCRLERCQDTRYETLEGNIKRGFGFAGSWTGGSSFRVRPTFSEAWSLNELDTTKFRMHDGLVLAVAVAVV